MNAGDLIHRIDLERDALTYSNGAEERTPAAYATGVPAKVEYLSGNERWKAQQVNAAVTVRVTLRYRADILASDRVVYRGRKYEIVAPPILDEARRESVVLECRG